MGTRIQENRPHQGAVENGVFWDQDAVRATSGAQYKIVSLFWHASTNGPLRANMSFVDGSMRLVNVVDDYKKSYIFYNEDSP